MGLGLVITILLLGAMLGLCARQTAVDQADHEASSNDAPPAEIQII